ncbi:MAG TPA: glutathione S-transferase family protein [Caulobacter sp.]|nr:glutathione S-transferase family protein [Caulobacter sp.]
MIELLEHPLSPYAQKVKIALAEKGVAFTANIPSAIGSGRTSEAFQAANPRGEVPVLFIEGQAIFDSTIILEFIEDRFPDPPLLPASPADRARVRMIEELCDTHYEAITWGLSEIVNFKRATGDQAEAMRARAGEELAQLHTWLEDQLGAREWFNGEAFGWGDLCVAPFVGGAIGFGFPPGPKLSAWFGRTMARPSVAAALEAARASLAAMAGVAQVVEAGLFKRQYRDHRLEWMIRSGGLSVVQAGLERGNIRFNSAPRAG